ncbi:MAG: hypothetical protein AAAB16_03355 [Pseudomonas sp.]|uniref:hypothetical protein n=1 Tax=Pseudomonas sp. TaxID=306 RepID=UPI0030F0B34E
MPTGESLGKSPIASGIDASVIKGVNKLTGWYDFAVLASDPRTVFINKNEDPRYGHTSITRGKPVLLAGEIMFDDSSNIAVWTNKSGHYEVGSHLPSKARSENKPELNSPESHRAYINSRVPVIDGLPLLPPHLLELWDGEL